MFDIRYGVRLFLAAGSAVLDRLQSPPPRTALHPHRTATLYLHIIIEYSHHGSVQGRTQIKTGAAKKKEGQKDGLGYDFFPCIVIIR